MVLGAYGFIGSAIAKELSFAGYQVTGFGRNLSYGRAILPDIQWCEGDLRQYCDPKSWLPCCKTSMSSSMRVEYCSPAPGTMSISLRPTPSSH
ncbi:NAD-dependent epimerase/dehydratase family protein [Sphingopyxis sp. BSNA05]|uniref:NAD-dependent epimerase/dehydratase family protein n=1 Tax=Sphingopyxis sp. BSNA05 TaxID=1236614 RepID=UPI00349F0ED6